MKVLFPLHGFVRWNGGIDLARLISSAIETVHEERGIQLTFAYPIPSAAKAPLEAILRRLRTIVAGARSVDSGGHAALLRSAREIAGSRPSIYCPDRGSGIIEAALKSKADVVFPTMLPLGKTGPTRIAYVFDFQHRHLPELFSARTRRNRDQRFRALTNDANGIVVNSRTVARDLAEFIGAKPEFVLTMPFAPHADDWWFEVEPSVATKKYGISDPYILICNHFWKHKDHATALRAFAKTRKHYPDLALKLVLTGDPVDHRDPGHYGRLLKLCNELELSDSAIFLGLIPKKDQLALLRGCAVLLQPTLFEGGPGGGSVYEAVGLDVPAIVSDISVNREIDQGYIRFFQAGNADDLAENIIELLAEPLKSPASANVLLARGRNNLRKLGNSIADYLYDSLS